MMTVVDVSGVSVTDISTDVISFIKQSSEIMDNHYPGRVARLVICNAPSFFYSVWAVIARVLPDSVRKKISIINGTNGLDKFIDPANRPVEYGGTGVPLGQAPEHKAFVQIARNWELGRLEDGLGKTGRGRGREDIHGRRRRSLRSHRRERSYEESEGEEEEGGEDGGRAEGDGVPPAASRDSESASPSHGQSASVSDGIFGWIRGRKTTEAFLGEKNRYRYDSNASAWTIDTTEATSLSERVPAKMSEEQIEEHGLVLAIQAAHLASLSKRDGAYLSSSSVRYSTYFSLYLYYHLCT
jgi:hypothetical protein